MAKSMTVQRKIYKINSKDIRHYTEIEFRKAVRQAKTEGREIPTTRKFAWRYDLDKNDKNKKEKIYDENIISLGESNTLRMLDLIHGKDSNIKPRYDKIKKLIKKLSNVTENFQYERFEEFKGWNVKKCYSELEKMQFQEDYIMIVFDKKSDYKKINRKNLELIFNGRKFKRLYGTSGSLKNNTVIYVCCEKLDEEYTIHGKLLEILENDRNKKVKMISSKYESYLSLNSSASTPTPINLNWDEILVCKDHVKTLKTEATLINSCIGDKPQIETKKDYEFELESSDGNGAITPELMKEFCYYMGKLGYISTGIVVRNSYIKGALYPFDIQQFIKEKIDNPNRKFVKDVWGNDVELSKIKMIMPISMFKLWNAYDSIEHYFKCCEKNHHQWSVTKMYTDLENERALNYQFLAPLDLTSHDINELVKPQIAELKDILGGDLKKTVLYTKGQGLNKNSINYLENDFLTALMIDDRMINDNFLRKSVYNMLRVSIDRAKVGKVKVKGNFQMIAGSIYGLLEHAIGNEITDGLLKEGEFYSGYWNERNVHEVVAMRAPACTHANFRKLKIVRNEELDRWYKYMQKCLIFNCHDSTAESLSGCDKDQFGRLL